MAREPRDWSERAFEVSQAQRRMQQAGAPPELPGSEDYDEVRRRPTWKWTAALVVVVAAAALLRNGANSRAPALAVSCTTPALALSTHSPRVGQTVRWAVTGRPGSRFLLAVGVARLVPGTEPGQLHPVPEGPGDHANHTQEASTARALPSSCQTSGAFSIQVPSGHYSVTLFQLTGTGTSTAGNPVAATSVAVS